jgi:sterol O-acyltransferase
MHSYMSHNGMLSNVAARLKIERAELERHLSTLPGGREAALAAANQRRTELEAGEGTDGQTPKSLSAAISLESVKANSGTMTPGTARGLTGYDAPAGAARRLQASDGRSRSDSVGATSPPRSPASSRSPNAPGSTSMRNRRRKNKTARDALPPPEADLPHGTSLEPSANTTPHEPREPNLLGWSQDERVALLARNIDAMEDELKSNGTRGLVWPQNVTYGHFADFMMMPTLVYQLEYPRTAT